MSLRRSRGLTLIELLVTITLVAVVTAAVLMGSGAVVNARMKSAANMIGGAARVAFTRASATSTTNRIVFDLDTSTIWIEESSSPMLIMKDDASGGAAAATQLERDAVTEAAKIVKGPRAPRALFTPVKAFGFDQADVKGGKPLGSGVKFRRVETAHSPDGQTSGRAYLYFWPGGQTERASIQLQIGEKSAPDEGLSILVAPLTGKIHTVSGAKPMEPLRDDGTASEREDKAF